MVNFKYSSGGTMRRTSLVAAATAALLCSTSWIAAGSQSSEPAPSSQKRPVLATRLYTGPDGQSHIDQSAIVLQNAPLADSTPLKMSDAYVVRAAPGMFESWHNADKKRYIVVISGEAEVTTTSGEKARIDTGQIYIAEDLTGKGHTFRVVGNEDWVALFVNFAQ
jgi:quercetin dioxygenase-like cupin family protein